MNFFASLCIVLFTGFVMFTCGSNEKVASKDELLVYLDSLEHEYEDACYLMGVANWNSYSKEGSSHLDEAKAAFGKIFLDSQKRSVIEAWRGKAGSLADDLLTRRLEMWHRCFIGGAIYADPDIAKLENSLQKRITDFRFMYDGKTITRAQISSRLREEKNQRYRHNLWQTNGQLSERAVQDLVLLVKKRNERAVMEGFPNYYSLSLHLNAIDERWLLETLEALEQQTRPMLQEFIDASKKQLKVKEFHPWDFDIALREAVSLPDKYFPSDSVFGIIHNFERGIGFSVDSLPIKEYVKDIPYGGLSLAIRVPTDSRFLVNPTRGKGFYETALHEYGHSLQAVYTDVQYPILKGYEWIPGALPAAYAEGIADFHKEFTDHPQWLSRYTNAKPQEINAYIGGKGMPSLYRMRRFLKDFYIEYEMYKNPDQDLTQLEKALYKKYLLVEMEDDDPHLFASNIWYTSYPCYFQNYILAGMIATQLQEALTNRFGDEKLSNPEVARWIIDHLYATGETTEWMNRIRSASGKSLETGAFLRKMGVRE